MTLQELLAEVKRLDAARNKLSYGYQEIREQALAAPILAKVVEKLVEQRNAYVQTLDMVAGHGNNDYQSDILNADNELDALVAKEEEGGSE